MQNFSKNYAENANFIERKTQIKKGLKNAKCVKVFRQKGEISTKN